MRIAEQDGEHYACTIVVVVDRADTVERLYGGFVGCDTGRGNCFSSEAKPNTGDSA
jgi:hypothetical protein